MSDQSVVLQGRIENIHYRTSINTPLEECDFVTSVNDWGSRCIVRKGDILYSVSKWVSPKRTRSYPYSRVYDTFSFLSGKKVTIIPIVKDEGMKGDRDFLQWSTVALMSLLNVYVIIGYYEDGEKSGEKITNQKFSDDFIKEQFEKLDNYHSSSLHWNLDQLFPSHLKKLLDKVIRSYEEMGKRTGVIFHNSKGITKFQEKLGETIDDFKTFSSLKSQGGQNREILTNHILESLGDGEKMKIVIENYLGGLYYFTVDDVMFKDDRVYLMECKHSNNSILPSDDDIKDGLLKLILFTNINKLYKDNHEVSHKSVIRLTSNRMIGSLSEKSTREEVENFGRENNLNERRVVFLTQLITEVRDNNINLLIEKV